MVLYNNINLNQRVEVIYAGGIYKGTVRYKGALNSEDGDWVGLELDHPVGRHNGLYRGIKYFESRANHGVFVRAGDVRFIQNTRRRLYNKYHKVWNSGVDEELFASTEKLPSDELRKSQEFQLKPPNDLFTKLGARYSTSAGFHLSGSVSRQIPAATMTRPFTAAAQYTYTSMPVHSHKTKDKHIWNPTPSIPKTHMPPSAQRKQTQRGWDNAHWTREIYYPKAKQTMKTNAWNDVSF